MTLEVGSKAPAFDLPADNGENLSLESLKGKKVVLYFYPRDDTPGCTVEAKEFTELASDFDKANTVVVGASKDTIAKHCKFIDKYGLKVKLISDEECKMFDAYGSWVEKSMYGKKYMGIQRDTFLIDEEGNIQNIWRKVKPANHAAEVLKEVA